MNDIVDLLKRQTEHGACLLPEIVEGSAEDLFIGYAYEYISEAGLRKKVVRLKSEAITNCIPPDELRAMFARFKLENSGD